MLYKQYIYYCASLYYQRNLAFAEAVDPVAHTFSFALTKQLAKQHWWDESPDESVAGKVYLILKMHFFFTSKYLIAKHTF